MYFNFLPFTFALSLDVRFFFLQIVVVVVVCHIQRIGCQPEKNTFHAIVANPACGALKREKNTKREKVVVWQRSPLPPTLVVLSILLILRRKEIIPK